MGLARNALHGLAILALLPFIWSFLAVYFTVWLAFTVSLIGPIAQLLATWADNRRLARHVGAAESSQSTESPTADLSPSTVHVHVAGAEPVHLVRVPSGARVAVRWTPGTRSGAPRVVIGNGLGATLVTISGLHEHLASLGFPVLSYDRAGVGMSDSRSGPGKAAGAEELVADMRAVMASVGGEGQWILVGPSMGSLVCQAFIARHPQDVGGFLNMDGVPYPFAAVRSRFEWAAVVYRIYASIVWTGVLRPFLYAASSHFRPLVSAAFPLQSVRAQMNQANFFASLGREMLTMMALADDVSAAWGPALDFTKWSAAELEPLVLARPAGGCGDYVVSLEGVRSWKEMPRSSYEPGADWAEPEPARDALAAAMGKVSSSAGTLPAIWPRLHVRVMAARDYNFGPASSFYSTQMQSWAAAEQALHALLAAPGSSRTVFPSKSHMNMFFGSEGGIAAQVVAIAEDMRADAKAQ